MSNEYPKQLYRKGWDDLSDTIVVDTAEAEEEARVAGFKMLSETPPADEESEAVETAEEESQPARRGRKPKAVE